MATIGVDTVLPVPHNEGMDEPRRQKTVIQVVVTPEFRDRVEEAAQREGLSKSSLVRRLLTLHLRQQEAEQD